MATEIAHAKDLRSRSEEELRLFVRDKTDELLKLRFQYATGQLENVRRLAQVRREIARANTVLREREIASVKKEQKS